MIKLNVPLEAQRKSLTCWHASALMIWYYWQGKSGRSGPMHSLADNWADNKILLFADFSKIAKNVGLMPLPDKDSFTEQSLEDLLRTYGPIFCAGVWYGPGHAIVLTGVDSGEVYINDPDQGKAKKETIAWFNQKLLKCKDRMMVKDPKRY